MPSIIKSKSFYLITLISAVIIFSAIAGFNRVYEARVLVLFLPKDEKTAQNLDIILENAKIFSARDPKVKAERVGKSSVIILKVKQVDSSQAKIIAIQSAYDLSQTMSRYYNIKTELDIRIIDKPVVSQSLKYNVFLLILLSLILGLAVSFLSLYISQLILSSISRPTPKTVAPLSLSNLSDKKIASPVDPPKISLPQEQKPVISFSKKAAAPSNLPVADESSLEEINGKLYPHTNGNPIIKEPTPEEIKERLNKLLSGEWKM